MNNIDIIMMFDCGELVEYFMLLTNTPSGAKLHSMMPRSFVNIIWKQVSMKVGSTPVTTKSEVARQSFQLGLLHTKG